MPDLLIADPPHDPSDLRPAADLLGLAPAELRLKANYPVPEIWFAGEDDEVGDVAEALAAVGLRTARVPGAAVPAIPEATEGGAFHLDGGAVRFVDGAEGAVLPADHAATLIVFTPRRPAPPEAPPSFVDCYWFEDGALRRWRVSAGRTDFGGLGADISPSATANVLHLVAACERRLPRAAVDRRLTNMQLRQRQSRGTPVAPGAPARKGYSYASRGLDALLTGLQPGLEAVGQAELASRLAFLTWGSRL